MAKLAVLYDDWCPNCRRFSRWIKKLDWLGLISLEKLRSIPEDAFVYSGLNRDLAQKEMATYRGSWAYGFRSLCRVTLRIPVFWPLFPVVYMLKLSGLGSMFYRYVAHKRQILPIHCTADSCSTVYKTICR